MAPSLGRAAGLLSFPEAAMLRSALFAAALVAVSTVPAVAVEWLSYQEGLARASAEGRPVMLLFDIGDENGKWFVERVLTGEKVDPYRDKFVAVRVKQSSDALWKKYGVESGPRVIFVSPDGDVLGPGYWRAEGALAGSMKEALLKHGPILPPKVKAEAGRVDREIREAMAKGQFARALEAVRRLEKLTSVDPYARRVKVTIDDLRARARGALERAAGVEETGDWLAASRGYEAIRSAFDGLDEAAEAAKVLGRYARDPKISGAIEQATREELAAEALAAAGELFEAKPHEGLRAWDEVAASWPETEAGARAKELAARTRDDAKAMAAVRESAAREVCPKLISLAKSYAAAGDVARAKEYLRRVVEEHPGTSYTAEAGKLLADLR